MIIFSCLKKEFDQFVEKRVISNQVYEAFKEKMGKKTKLNQIKSWANSLPMMYPLLKDLPENVGIAIEFNIPLTSKRVDFIVSGYDKNHNPVIPFVYLHNYHFKENDDLLLRKFKKYYLKAPIYTHDDEEQLKNMITRFIVFGDDAKIIKAIDQSKTKPNKKLLDSIEEMIQDKKEYTLLDEQKIIAETIKKEVKNSFATNQKKVIIVKGGPGTGKSVLAIQLLGELLKIGLMGAYVSKNMAPRKVYKNSLVNNNEISIHELFKSSGYFFFDYENKYDFLLVDEAHRLQEKSGIHNNIGENQIKEIIYASKTSVFFIDEKQMVTLKDIGTIANIKHFAYFYQANVEEFELNSQFRCNGSDFYLDLLYNKRGSISFQFDFRVMDSPNELRELIKQKNTNNNARLVAGFCWTRNAKNADNQNYMDIHIGDFEASWNLKHGEPFATRKSAIYEVGCVHNVQGLEFDYIGVIIGPDLKYEQGKVVTDYKKRANTEKSLYGLRVLMKQDKEYYEKLADTLIRNTYRVLLTRGIKGCYVYACDLALQKYLKKIISKRLIHS